MIEAALRLVEEGGLESLTMRRLAEELGTAVTSIYWHVGNRDALVDQLVERILAEIGTIQARGSAPEDRITSLARSLRDKLLARPHLVGLADRRGRTAAMFQPVQAAIAHELAQLGVRGAEAAIAVQALQVHVVASVVLQRTTEARHSTTETTETTETTKTTDATAWPREPDDPELVASLAEPPNFAAVFEFGLQSLVLMLGDLQRPSFRPGSM
ncbi:MAG: TetR/AcrR family transcriptional regulator [Mycobacterium sp.]